MVEYVHMLYAAPVPFLGEPYAEKLISQVFMGNHGMIHVLLKEVILQKWYEDPDKKDTFHFV